MNKKIKIVKIDKHPEWNSGHVGYWRVTVQFDGETRKIETFCTHPDREIFLDYVRQTVLYGNQWHDLEQRKKKEEKELQNRVEKEIPTFVGTEIST